MEKVTDEMSKIARKTKTETVSMKIITLVTLFFLPGTFIAVSGLLLICLVSHCTVALDSPNTCSLFTQLLVHAFQSRSYLS